MRLRDVNDRMSILTLKDEETTRHVKSVTRNDFQSFDPSKTSVSSMATNKNYKLFITDSDNEEENRKMINHHHLYIHRKQL